MSSSEIEIIFSKGGAPVLRKTLKPGDYVIGRGAGCDLPVDIEEFSERHAQVSINGDQCLIEDLGSRSGTFVNGKLAGEMTRLGLNQKVEVGSVTIEFRRREAEPDAGSRLQAQNAAIRRLLPSEFSREKRYAIGGVVAQGGMGAILDAREATTQRTVAMKVMLSDLSEAALLRFIEEAQITSQLEHRNILPVHEPGLDPQARVFYKLREVKGVTRRTSLERRAKRYA